MAVGRYDEPRLLYVAPEFALGPRPTDEHRTIHIGLDLFAAAGTPVFAPLDGTSCTRSPTTRPPQDYGPVIVLRHETDDGDEFFTLYGHLSRESLAGLDVGRAVAAGEQIATLGSARRERRMDAAPASADHHRSPRTRHRFPRRRAADAARGVDRALP